MVVCGLIKTYRMKMLPDEARWLQNHLKKIVNLIPDKDTSLAEVTLGIAVSRIEEQLATIGRGQAFDINFTEREAIDIKKALQNPLGPLDDESAMDTEMRVQFWKALNIS